jgi:uncharacterized membrane protein YfhO
LIPNDASFPPNYFGALPVYAEINFGNVNVVDNRNAFERAYLVNKYEVIPDRKDIYPQVLTGTEDLSKMAYLEEEPELPISSDSISTDSARIIFYEQDSIVVGVNCAVNRLLVLTDNYYDSWHAFVDGQPAKPMRSYGSFRAVAVPAGAKEVVFKYESERYAKGRLVSIATSLYLLIVFGFFVVRERYRKKIPAEV